MVKEKALESMRIRDKPPERITNPDIIDVIKEEVWMSVEQTCILSVLKCVNIMSNNSLFENDSLL